MPGSASVVIPALNEAHHLHELLPEITQQTLRPLEVIVADAGSTDGTREVAEAYGARVVAGGRPATGRNSGARAASGDWLCFIDADTRLPERTTLEWAIAEAERQRVQAVVADYRPYYREGDLGFCWYPVRVYDRVMLSIVSHSQRVWLKRGFPFAQAVFLLTRRRTFLDLGGFDERTEPFEDSEYVLRVHRGCTPAAGCRSAVGSMPRGFHVWVSTRRYDALGRLRFPISMGIRGGILRFLLGREMPDHSYWELNEQGRYRERHTSGESPARRRT